MVHLTITGILALMKYSSMSYSDVANILIGNCFCPMNYQ